LAFAVVKMDPDLQITSIVMMIKMMMMPQKTAENKVIQKVVKSMLSAHDSYNMYNINFRKILKSKPGNCNFQVPN